MERGASRNVWSTSWSRSSPTSRRRCPTGGAEIRRPRLRIAEPEGFSREALELLSACAEVDLARCAREELPAILDEYDVFWFRFGHRLDSDLLANAGRCRIVACPATGLDHIAIETAAARSIEVVSLAGETEFLQDIRATAELTVGLVLALIRKIPWAARAAADGTWDRDRFIGRELLGKTVGLVGLGRLGRIVGEYFEVFGATVVGFDPGAELESGERAGSLEELLARSDIVSVHASYDRSTHHLVNRNRLALMKPGAFLINTSRGGLIDEAALLEALRSGRLAGAALDVLENERAVTRGHPLLEYSRSNHNLLLVPHIGGCTVESFEKTEVFLAHKVVAALRQSG